MINYFEKWIDILAIYLPIYAEVLTHGIQIYVQAKQMHSAYQVCQKGDADVVVNNT